MRCTLLALLVACHPASDHKLPGATITPQVLARVAPTACGVDVALDGNSQPDIRYRYTFDPLGRLARADGTYASGATDTIDYTWDNLDHLVHSLQTRGWGDARIESTASYDTLGDLVHFATTQTAPHYADARSYVLADFTDAGQPATERVAIAGEPDHTSHLEYDTENRIARIVEDTGSVTTYSYDDVDSRTVTIDTDGGAYHGVISYDEDNRELAESWDGTAEVANDMRYEWSTDRLLTVTYRAATQEAPHELHVYELDTLRYDCASR